MNTTVDIYEKYKKQIDELTNVNPELGNFYKGEFLKKEAKKRGFLTRGNCFKSRFNDYGLKRYIEPFKNGRDINLYLDEYGFIRYKDGISIKNGGCSNPVIFKNGVWAEIIDDKAELKQEIKELRNKLKSLEEKL